MFPLGPGQPSNNQGYPDKIPADYESTNNTLQGRTISTSIKADTIVSIAETKLSPEEIVQKDELITKWKLITTIRQDEATLLTAQETLVDILISDYSDPILYQFFKSVGIRPEGGFFSYDGNRTGLYYVFKDARKNFAQEFFNEPLPVSVSPIKVPTEGTISDLQNALITEFQQLGFSEKKNLLIVEFQQLGFPEEKIVPLLNEVKASKDCSLEEALCSIFIFMKGLQIIDAKDPEGLTAFAFVDRRFTSKQGTIYESQWYTQEEITYATGYAKSLKKDYAQTFAEDTFKGFISWSAGSNCHDRMPVDEEGFVMEDPMNNNQQLFFPNSEGTFQYLKLCHFYSKMSLEQQTTFKQEINKKIKNAEGNFLDPFSDPFTAASIGERGFVHIPNWDENDWNNASANAMVIALKGKFKSRHEFFLKLLSSIVTKRKFAFLKPHPIWGTGLYGEGDNRLGKCLHTTRDMLNEELFT